MKRSLLVGVLAAALATSTPAVAAMNFSGQTGLGRIPTAEVLAPATLGLAADYTGAEDLSVPVRLAFGVVEGLEVGAHYDVLDTKDVNARFGAGAKYRLPVAAAEGLGVAVGANFVRQTVPEGDDATTLVFSAVASYEATIGGGMSVQPSVGLSWERVDAGADTSGVRFFGGVLVKVLPGLGAGVEFISSIEDVDGEDAQAGVWGGVRWQPIGALVLQAGFLNNANVGGEDRSDYVFHAGAQYAFGFAR